MACSWPHFFLAACHLPNFASCEDLKQSSRTSFESECQYAYPKCASRFWISSGNLVPNRSGVMALDAKKIGHPGSAPIQQTCRCNKLWSIRVLETSIPGKMASFSFSGQLGGPSTSIAHRTCWLRGNYIQQLTRVNKIVISTSVSWLFNTRLENNQMQSPLQKK